MGNEAGETQPLRSVLYLRHALVAIIYTTVAAV